MKKEKPTKKELHLSYWGRGLSLRHISYKFGLTEATIRKYMIEYGIPRRSRNKK